MKAQIGFMLLALVAVSVALAAKPSRITVDDFKQAEREDPRAGQFMEFYEFALALAEKEESKRSTAQTTCQVPTGMTFCTMVNWPTSTDASLDAYLAQSANFTFNENADCEQSYKNLICTMLFRGCDTNAEGTVRVHPICRSQCIDFATKCAVFYTGGICTDPRVYLPDNDPQIPCTKSITAPLPTCTFPTFDTGACAAYTTYTTPTGPNLEVNAQLSLLTTSFFSVLNFTIEAALAERTTTLEQADLCYQTYQRMLCRYIFLECTGGDPFDINVNCDLTCQDLYFSCPFMRPEGYQPPAEGEIDDSCGLVLPGCKPLPIGFTWGDPHFQTLDGAPFEFNGLGEFTIVTTTDADAVQVQARFEKCNSQSDATCTTAAGVKGYGHSVRLYSDANTVRIRADSQTLNVDTTNWPYSLADGQIVVSRQSGTQNFEVQTKNGLSFQYRLQEGFTMIAVGAGSGLKTKLKGFYGNFDGLRANDFETSAGAVINFPPTASETFAWGQTWRTTEADSVFDYDNGKTYAQINNASYVPAFSDSVTFSAAAKEACEGLSDQFYRSCLFDVTVTGDVNFARASTLAQSRIQELTTDNTPITEVTEGPTVKSDANLIQLSATIVASLLIAVFN